MKIIWSKALADYLKDETESYASIARKHGVSLQAVKKRAGKEGWVSLRQKSGAKIKGRKRITLQTRFLTTRKYLKNLMMRKRDMKKLMELESLLSNSST